MTDGSSATLIDNPLRAPEPEAPAAPEPAPVITASPAGTSFFVVNGLDVGFALYFDAPLTDDESRALRQALEPVLAKYSVPNIPLAEELQLIATLAALIVPRVKLKIEQRRAAEAAESEPDAAPIVRPEGVREINSAPSARGASFGSVTAEAAGLVP